MAFFFSPSSYLTLSTIPNPNLNPYLSPPKCFTPKRKKIFFKPPKCTINPPTSDLTSSSSCKLDHIVTEFRSLSEPVDRVKRLLHYATLLPEFNEVDRVSSNRVTGCTVEVWLDVSMDEFGRMRFSADSDSEIMKGFCSCLIWLLDGEFPEEVLKLKMEDLEVLNIGLYGRAKSRVNTWNNVLISMKKRTQVLINNSGSSSLCFSQS